MRTTTQKKEFETNLQRSSMDEIKLAIDELKAKGYEQRGVIHEIKKDSVYTVFKAKMVKQNF